MVTLQEALKIAPKLEAIAAANGCHIGLTGGLLYKSTERKDADFVVYKHNDDETVGKQIARNDFENALRRTPEVRFIGFFPRVTKIMWEDLPIDLIYAEQFGCYTEIPNTFTLKDEPAW